MVLLFWCWLTQVILDKRPLNECSSSSSTAELTDYILHPATVTMIVLFLMECDIVGNSQIFPTFCIMLSSIALLI